MARYKQGFGFVSPAEARNADQFFADLMGQGRLRSRGEATWQEDAQDYGEAKTIEDEIKDFLTANAKSKVHDEAHGANVSHALVMYCETHVGNVQKAAFFAELVRRGAAVTGSTAPRFHASERFASSSTIRKELHRYIHGSRPKRLTQPQIRYQEMFDAMAAVPGRTFAVIPSNDPAERDGNKRHKAIYDGFIAGRNAHNTKYPSNKLDDSSHGHFLIGGFHGGRVNVDSSSSAKTTTQLLLAHNTTSVQVIRVYVNEEGEFRDDGTIIAGEFDTVHELTKTAEISLLPILRTVNGGKSFFVPIRGKGSVFGRLRNDTRTTIPYDQVYDAILYLDEPLAQRYRVVRGDTLSGIAKKKLGDGNRWREIYTANEHVVGPNPNLIFPDQLLVIPGTTISK